MRKSHIAIALAAALFTAAAAADDLADKALNKPEDSWGFWGSTKIEQIADAKAPGGTINRVTISPRPANPWDAGAYITIVKPVKKGDVILLAFWARAFKPPVGDDFIQINGRVFEKAPPQTSITPETGFLIGREWKMYYASGVADKDYDAGAMSVGIVLGTGEQVIDFATGYVADYGPDYDIATLPSN